jgi:aspartate/tyrosine/aromatic aminotransferase
MCTDKLFIVFVVCEYFKYLAASLSDVHTPNRMNITSNFVFSVAMYEYRNAFAHSESIDKLCRDLENIKEYADVIYTYFPSGIRDKVYIALTK